MSTEFAMNESSSYCLIATCLNTVDTFITAQLEQMGLQNQYRDKLENGVTRDNATYVRTCTSVNVIQVDTRILRMKKIWRLT